MPDLPTVIKINGDKEKFSESKIRRSATRVGVPPELQDELIVHIKSKLYENIPTTEIFQMIKKFLRNSSQPQLSTMYNLKQAILELGPSGYPFEKYLSAVLAKHGYNTVTNQIITGKCTTHEVDVVAHNDANTYMVEAKFHSKQSIKTDIKVTLYIKSRFDDIQAAWSEQTEVLPWIITNARFTSDATRYGKCVGLRLTSWDYPSKESLRDLVEEVNLHPITMLDTASRKSKNLLLKNGIVTCQQLITHKDKASHFIPEENLANMVKEATQVCEPR